MTAGRNIVFDMGNVLMTFDGREFARAFTSNEKARAGPLRGNLRTRGVAAA